MKLLAYNIADARTKDGQSLSALLRALGAHVTEAQDLEQQQIGDCDAVLFYGDLAQPQQPYIVALSLAQQKPVIFLYEKGSPIPQTIRLLQEDKKLSALIHVRHTQPSSLSKDVSDLLGNIEKGPLKEIPSIKFTLRITPTIERYLQWKSQESGLSKADVLREFIEKDLIEKDSDFPRS